MNHQFTTALDMIVSLNICHNPQSRLAVLAVLAGVAFKAADADCGPTGAWCYLFGV